MAAAKTRFYPLGGVTASGQKLGFTHSPQCGPPPPPHPSTSVGKMHLILSHMEGEGPRGLSPRSGVGNTKVREEVSASPWAPPSCPHHRSRDCWLEWVGPLQAHNNLGYIIPLTRGWCTWHSLGSRGSLVPVPPHMAHGQADPTCHGLMERNTS